MKKTFLNLFIFIFLVSVAQANHPGKIKHVVIIGLDGFGSYAVEKADMPNLKKLMAEGSYTLHKRTVLPSSSAVNWASMFMGAGPTMHGYTEWGSQTPEIPFIQKNDGGLFPSIFSQIKKEIPHSKTAAIYSWGGIGYLIEKKSLDIDIPTEGDEELTLKKTEDVLKNEKPTLTFIHFDEPDGVGHNKGHDTPEYYEELKNVDKRIGKIIEAIKEAGIASQTLVTIVSDHGGKDKGHGGKSIEEVETPWIFWGAGVAKGKEIKTPTIVYDLAPTLAHALEINAHSIWRGKTIEEFFN